ncbi:MAG TPA: hypothetical protein VFS43_19760 [Polyangiaceae bacterium]|nr:hypothetical protein [Polyangiaceae bacterium]
MAQVLFCRTPLTLGRRVRPPTARELAGTPSLFDVSLDDALRRGGAFVAAVLGAMALRHDRRDVIVQVQVANLAAGEIPNGAGWHTDGVPVGPGRYRYASDDPAHRPDRFHSLVAGAHCRTAFAVGPIWLDDPGTDDAHERRLYFTRELGRLRPEVVQVPNCRLVEYDGWALHAAVPAAAAGWRAFIRAVETDHGAPRPLPPEAARP